MKHPLRNYEIRCPVHGFIQFNDWEREIIDHPAFQRLRRIRQLAWSDHIYPGAVHTRFEHSLGVMHVATRLFDAIRQRCRAFLEEELTYTPNGLDRDRCLVRLAALLHDVGHGPFSHAAEGLLPRREASPGSYKHEDYSAAIVRGVLKDVIENHALNQNWDLKADQVAAFLEGRAGVGRAAFWREVIVGQMDADRMDYLLRDSLHTGVQYGRFDLERLINTVEAIPGTEEEAPRLGVGEGGWHAAEELILARRSMFAQVYFHKTRGAFDYHLGEALKELLPDGQFPPPSQEGLREYLAWDDWRVLGLLAAGHGGEHGRRLATRDHYREVYHTPEVPLKRDLTLLEKVRKLLGTLLAAEVPAAKSWYKVGAEDIPVLPKTRQEKVRPLSNYSSVVANLKPNGQVKLYVRREDQNEAERRLHNLRRKS